MIYAYVTLISIISYITSADIYAPAMPNIAEEFGRTSSQVQSSITMFLVGSLLASLIAGLFSDRLGRKRTFVVTQVLAFFGALVCMIAPSLDILVLGCFLQGTGIVAMVIGFAAIQDLYPKEQATKLFGLIGALMVLVPSIAPLAGGFINDTLGWRYVFVFTAICLLFSTSMAWIYLPQSLNDTKLGDFRTILVTASRIFKNRDFIAYGMLSPILTSAMWFYLTFLPFYAQINLNVTATMYGAVMGVIVLFYSLGSTIGTPLIRRYGVDGAINIAILLAFIGSIVCLVVSLYFAHSFFLIAFSLSIFLVGFGILFPSSVSQSLSFFENEKTVASSARMIMISVLSLGGCAWAEYVNDTWLLHLPIYLLVASACVLLCFNIRTVKHQQ